MEDGPVESWKSKIQWYSDNNYFSELNRTDGQPTEFKWKIFPGFTTEGILNEIQQLMGKLQCEPENLTGRIIFTSMFNDTVCDANGNDDLCVNNSNTMKEYAERFTRGHWSVLGPGFEKKWYDCKPDGSWSRTAEKILQNFAGSGHPIFRCASALERGPLRSKEGGNTTFHFTASVENVRLLLNMVMSVNQLSLYGAVADMIAELPDDQRTAGLPVALDQMEQEILTRPPIAEVQANDERQGNLLQDYESEDLKVYQKTRSYPNWAPIQV